MTKGKLTVWNTEKKHYTKEVISGYYSDDSEMFIQRVQKFWLVYDVVSGALLPGSTKSTRTIAIDNAKKIMLEKLSQYQMTIEQVRERFLKNTELKCDSCGSTSCPRKGSKGLCQDIPF